MKNYLLIFCLIVLICAFAPHTLWAQNFGSSFNNDDISAFEDRTPMITDEEEQSLSDYLKSVKPESGEEAQAESSNYLVPNFAPGFSPVDIIRAERADDAISPANIEPAAGDNSYDHIILKSFPKNADLPNATQTQDGLSIEIPKRFQTQE